MIKKRKGAVLMHTNYNLENVLVNKIETLEKRFAATKDEEKRKQIFLEIEVLYRELDKVRSGG